MAVHYLEWNSCMQQGETARAAYQQEAKGLGIPWWLSRLRSQPCHCCGMGSIPGLGTSAFKKKKRKKERKEMEGSGWQVKYYEMALYQMGSLGRVLSRKLK